jgi:predicted O-methyltransferase YrrM
MHHGASDPTTAPNGPLLPGHPASTADKDAARRDLVRLLQRYAETPSDINQHLYTLCDYAKRCQSIAELGVAAGTSTAALACGLAAQAPESKQLLCVDIDDCSAVEALALARRAGIDACFVQADSVSIDIPDVDLLFIDTWHCHGHLRRELRRHQHRVRSWIILHDTEIDGYTGESVRRGQDLIGLQQATGYSIDELYRGLGFALDEFLAAAPQWRIERIFRHNNGLTVLRREARAGSVGHDGQGLS